MWRGRKRENERRVNGKELLLEACCWSSLLVRLLASLVVEVYGV